MDEAGSGHGFDGRAHWLAVACHVLDQGRQSRRIRRRYPGFHQYAVRIAQIEVEALNG